MVTISSPMQTLTCPRGHAVCIAMGKSYGYASRHVGSSKEVHAKESAIRV
jgi:hypothetical protein